MCWLFALTQVKIHLYLHLPISPQVDIWGVGIMAYDVLVGCPPFNSDEPNATVEAILLKEVEYPDLLSDDAVDFIDQVGSA